MSSEKTVRVIMVRHGSAEDLGRGATNWSPEARLTDKGKEQMKATARRWHDLFVQAVFFVASPLIRAQESLFAMIHEIGYPNVLDLVEKVHARGGLRYKNPKVWLQDGGPRLTFAEIYRRDPQGIEAEGHHVLDAILKIAEKMEDGQTALCVGHGGPLDAAYVLAYAGDDMVVDESEFLLSHKQFGNGEGAIFIVRNGHLVGTEKLLNE